MFDRFTDRSKKVMNLARQESLRFNHEYLGPEHILLGIVQLGEGVAVQVLQKMSIDLGTIRTTVGSIVVKGPSAVTITQLPFTPRAKKVLELTMEEAGSLGHNYLGTEHVLLGLIKENESVAAHVLLGLGATLTRTRALVLEFLETDAPARGTMSASGAAFPVQPSRVAVPLASFTDRLKRVWDIAQQMTIAHGQPSVRPEHMLAALVTESKGVAADVLRLTNTDAVRIRGELARWKEQDAVKPTSTSVAVDPALRAVITLAFAEAASTKSNPMGTGHMLLGLLQQDGTSARILREAGLELETAQKTLRECLRRIDDDPIWDHVG